MTNHRRKKLRPIALLCALLIPAAPLVAAETNHWHFDASLNLFMAGLSGDVTARGIPATVDASFGDIWENLEAALAGKLKAGYDRWTSPRSLVTCN